MGTKAWGTVAVVGLLLWAAGLGSDPRPGETLLLILQDVGLIALVVGAVGYVVVKRRNRKNEEGAGTVTTHRR